MNRPKTPGCVKTHPTEDGDSVLVEAGSRPLGLEELDQRLEAAFLSISGFHASEPCVWACACFLVDGSPP